MKSKLPFPVLNKADDLAEFGFCSLEANRDLLAVQKGNLSEGEFKQKYRREAAIFSLNMNGLTRAAIEDGSLHSLLKIITMQQICGPVFHEFKAKKIRAFADDFVALFDNPQAALESAFEIHRRLHIYNETVDAEHGTIACGIGIGFGTVYRIGIDEAMGDEMNRSAKLGEDIARNWEILVSEKTKQALDQASDYRFIERTQENIPFSFFEVIKE